MARSLILLFVSFIIPCIHSLSELSTAGLETELQKFVGNSTALSRLVDVHPYENGTFIPLQICYELFGRSFTPYHSKRELQTLTIWWFPLIVLVGNMYMPRFTSLSLDIRHFLAVTGHLLADPVDTIWSLLCKLDVLVYSYEGVRSIDPGLNDKDVRRLATILVALHDHPDTRSTSRDTVRHLIQEFRCHPSSVRRAAERLTDLRVNNTRRAAIAIGAYIATVGGALVRSLNEVEAPINLLQIVALRQLYYWLLPAIVLSCMAGGFPSSKTSRAVLEDNYLAEVLSLGNQQLQPWNGGTYSLAVDRRMDSRKAWLLILAYAAVSSAWAFAFATSWISPTPGLKCGGILQLLFLGIWIGNNCLNWGLYKSFKPTRDHDFKRCWKWVMIKDITLSIGMSVVLFVVFKGAILLFTA
jgi:hypothetical protein